jgi:Lrp/AsnC family transcriptional regulator for asnA, asnC and gidA
MVRPIDALDRSIIHLLQEDSRMPSAEIARRLGVAERTVRARINRLVEDGIVKLVAIVNPSALGYDVTADIFLEVEPGRLEEVAQQLVAMEEVAYVGLTTGERDISIQVFLPSVDALYRFITEKTPANSRRQRHDDVRGSPRPQVAAQLVVALGKHCASRSPRRPSSPTRPGRTRPGRSSDLSHQPSRSEQ